MGTPPPAPSQASSPEPQKRAWGPPALCAPHSVSEAFSPCLPQLGPPSLSAAPGAGRGVGKGLPLCLAKGSFSANGFSPGQKRCMHLQQEREVPGGGRDLLVTEEVEKTLGVSGRWRLPAPVRPGSAPGPWKGRDSPLEASSVRAGRSGPSGLTRGHSMSGRHILRRAWAERPGGRGSRSPLPKRPPLPQETAVWEACPFLPPSACPAGAGRCL